MIYNIKSLKVRVCQIAFGKEF